MGSTVSLFILKHDKILESYIFPFEKMSDIKLMFHRGCDLRSHTLKLIALHAFAQFNYFQDQILILNYYYFNDEGNSIWSVKRLIKFKQYGKLLFNKHGEHSWLRNIVSHKRQILKIN